MEFRDGTEVVEVVGICSRFLPSSPDLDLPNGEIYSKERASVDSLRTDQTLTPSVDEGIQTLNSPVTFAAEQRCTNVLIDILWCGNCSIHPRPSGRD